MFKDRRGNIRILKRPLGGGDNIVYTVTKGSLWRLRREIDRIYKKEENKPYKASELSKSDDFFERWKADNDSNLIDLERN